MSTTNEIEPTTYPGKWNSATTLDQKTSRAILLKYGEGNIPDKTIHYLRRLTNSCYWKRTTDGIHGFMERKDTDASLRTIARHVACSVNTLLHHMQIAEDLGLVTINHLPDGKITHSLHLDPMLKWLPSKECEKVEDEADHNHRSWHKRMQRHEQRMRTDLEYEMLHSDPAEFFAGVQVTI